MQERKGINERNENEIREMKASRRDLAEPSGTAGTNLCARRVKSKKHEKESKDQRHLGPKGSKINQNCSKMNPQSTDIHSR